MSTFQEEFDAMDRRYADALADELSSMRLATGSRSGCSAGSRVIPTSAPSPATKPLICPRATEYKSKNWRRCEKGPLFLRFVKPAQLSDLAAGAPSDERDTDKLIQFVRHPQMASADPLRTVRWFRGAAGGGDFVEKQDKGGFNKANDFMNFSCHCAECGKGKGWFYELNLYVKPGSTPSAHHTSTVHGVIAPRSTESDGTLETTKGPHWARP